MVMKKNNKPKLHENFWTSMSQSDKIVKSQAILVMRGGGKSFEEIAETLGLPNAAVAKGVVDRAVKNVTQSKKDVAERIRNKHLQELECMIEETRGLIDELQQRKDGKATKKGKIDVYLYNESVKLLNQSVGSLVKLYERVSRLVGADAPTKSEVSVNHGDIINIFANVALIVLGDHPDLYKKFVHELDKIEYE